MAEPYKQNIMRIGGGSMQITVTGKHLELSDSLHTRVWGDLEEIARRYHSSELMLANVTFRRERRFFICEISLRTKVTTLRSQGGSATAYHAFTRAIDPLQKRLAEARSRRYHRRAEPQPDSSFRALLKPDPEA
jgi:ribosomal subunit interface protein